MNKKPNVICITCYKLFYVKPSRLLRGVKFCSKECQDISYLIETRTITKDGYIQITGNGKNILEHRLIMENYLGRKLTKDEQVHHKNENKQDNRIENLILTDCSTHISEYHPKQIDESTWMECHCLSCGKPFQRRKKEYDRHPECYCSRDCYRRSR